MTAHRWLGASLAIGIAAAGFTSCKRSAGATSSATGSGGATGGGASSGGVTGGGTPGTGGTTGDAGPIVCTAQNTNIPKTGACDLINQDCPPGQTCKPVLVNGATTTGCIPQSGLKAAGEDCYGANECDAKLICVGSPQGTCVAFCCNNGDSEPCNGGLCNTQVSFGTGGAFAYVCNYGQRCTLLAPDPCPPGLDCHIENASQGLALCGKPSPTPVGEQGLCHFLNDCATMEDCYALPDGTESVCLYYCAVSGPHTSAAPGLGGCPSGEACETSYEGQTINTGVSGVGLCIPASGIKKTDGGPTPTDAGSDG
jgi:hypothetical protein